MFGSILNQIADIFKSSKGKGDDHGGNFDLLRFWLEYQQIKEQWQELKMKGAYGATPPEAEELPPPDEEN